MIEDLEFEEIPLAAPDTPKRPSGFLQVLSPRGEGELDPELAFGRDWAVPRHELPSRVTHTSSTSG